MTDSSRPDDHAAVVVGELVLDVVLEVDVVVEPCSVADVATRAVVDGAGRVVGGVASTGSVTALGVPAGVGTVITTTMDCGGGGTSVVTAIVEPGALLDGILATASSSFCSSWPTLSLRSLASATAASRLSRSVDSRSEDRILRATPARVTIAERTAPARMACAGLSVRSPGRGGLIGPPKSGRSDGCSGPSVTTRNRTRRRVVSVVSATAPNDATTRGVTRRDEAEERTMNVSFPLTNCHFSRPTLCDDSCDIAERQ